VAAAAAPPLVRCRNGAPGDAADDDPPLGRRVLRTGGCAACVDHIRHVVDM